MTTQGRLAGKVAVVTGGAQGIGRGIAHRFAEEGATVVVADIQEERGRTTVAELTAKGGAASFSRTDVSEPAQLEQMIEHAVAQHGRLDVLINNAFWSKAGSALELDLEDWNHAMSAMVTASFLGAKYAVPQMERAGGGSIICVSSVHGLLAAARHVVYEAAKAALLMLVKQMAVDFGPLGVRVNTICPGMVMREPEDRHDELRGQAVQIAATPEPFVAQFRKQTFPLRRWGTPRDIANAALFLASEEASWVTGHALVVDGGITAQVQGDLSTRMLSFVREYCDRQGIQLPLGR